MCNGFLLYKLIRTCRVQLRHHSLNGSSDSVRPNGDLQFLWEYANFNPRQNRYPLNWSTKKLAQLITCTRGPPTQMWHKSTDWRLLAKWVKYNKTYFLFIGPTFFSGSLQVIPVDGFLRTTAQKTWNHAFWGVWMMSSWILWVKPPKSEIFGDVNRTFKPERQKKSNPCNLKTT